MYFITYTVQNWIDLFIRNEYKDILIESWNHCRNNKGLNIHAWTIMTSHAHMIISAQYGNPQIIIRDMKKWTSLQLHHAIITNERESRKEWLLQLLKKNNNNEFSLWQEGSHPIELTSSSMIRQKLQYIHNNPVEAGIVDLAEYYKYSSAKDYYFGVQGLIKLDLIESILL